MQVNFILVKNPNDIVPKVYFGNNSEETHNDIVRANGVKGLFVIGSGSALLEEKVFMIGPITEYVAFGPCSREQMVDVQEVKNDDWSVEIGLAQK